MKEFFAQYFLNLWIYGSQALVLFFAGRTLWAKYEARQERKQYEKLAREVDAASGVDSTRSRTVL